MMNDGKIKTTSRLLALLLALFMILPLVAPEPPLLADETEKTTETTEPQETTSTPEPKDTEEGDAGDQDADPDAADSAAEPGKMDAADQDSAEKSGTWRKDAYSELPVADDALVQQMLDSNLQVTENGFSFKARMKFAAQFVMGDPGAEGEFGMSMPILFNLPFDMKMTREGNFEFNLNLALAMMGQKQNMSTQAYLVDHPTDPEKLQMVVVSNEGSGPTYHISEVERSELDEIMNTSREASQIPLEELKKFADYRVLEEGEETTTLMLLISPREFLSYLTDAIENSEVEADPETKASAEEAIELIDDFEETMEDALNLDAIVVPFEIEIDKDTALLKRFELRSEGLKDFASFDLSDFVVTEDAADDASDSLGQMSFELKKFEFVIDEMNYDVPGKLELPAGLREEIEKSVAAESESVDIDVDSPTGSTTEVPGNSEANGTAGAASDDAANGNSTGTVLPASDAPEAAKPDETDALLEQGILFDHENKTLYDEDAVYEMVKDLRPEFSFEKPDEELMASEGEEDEDGRIIEIFGDRILVTVENTTPYPIADLSFKGKSEESGEMISFYFQDYALLPGEKAAYQVIEATDSGNRIQSAEDFSLDELTVSFWDAEDHISRVIYNVDADKITGSSGSGTDYDVLRKEGPFDPASFVLEVGIDDATKSLIYTVKNNSEIAVVYFELLTTTEDLSSSTFYCNEVLLPGNESSTQESFPVNPITNLSELKPRRLRVTLNENGKEINVFYDYGLRRFIIR